MSQTILIGDTVVAKTNSSGFPYEGVSGHVTTTRTAIDGTIEHFVVFPTRAYTQEEMDRGEDTQPDENKHWLRHSELSKG